MEKPVVFEVGREQLVGMLHIPKDGRQRVPGVVFFHGFTGSKVEAHRLFVKMARALAQAGIVAFRFDFRGSGDSSGDFSRMTISRELEDARAALKFLRAQREVNPRRLGVIGFSMGGLIAAEILGENKNIQAGVLWAPVADLKFQIAEKLTPEARGQLRELGCVDYGGFAVGEAFFSDIKHDPLKAVARTSAAVLVVHGANDETVPVSFADAYEKALRTAKKTCFKHIIKDADHTFARLAWETELMAVTLDWLRLHLGSEARKK